MISLALAHVLRYKKPTSAPPSSVAFDAVSSAHVSASGTATLSWTHTPVGAPTAVGVAFYVAFAGGVSSVTYGGVACTLENSTTDGNGTQIYIYGLANPPGGPQTVAVTCNLSGFYAEAGAITVTGSNTSTCFSNSAIADSTGTTASATVSSSTQELVMDVVGTSSGGITASAGGSQTEQWGQLSDGGDRAQGSTSPGGASVNMTWSLGGSAVWAQVAASFKHP